MRELKFRALELDVGRFVLGYYVAEHGYYMNNGVPDLNEPVVRHYIIGDSGKHDVCEDTVCQFTGLKDKNGVEIYEGDILSSGKTYYLVDICGYYSKASVGFGVNYSKDGDTSEFSIEPNPFGVESTLSVVGNKYENPELLESK